MSLSLLIVVICVVLALARIRLLPLPHELAARLPGPRTLPLLGNFDMFFGLEPHQVAQLIGQLADKYDGTFKLKMGSNFSIMMFKPSDVELVLGSTQLLDKAVEYEFLRGWLNEGLLVSSGRKWHRRRKIITPAFHFRILEQFVEIFDRQTRQLVKLLSQTHKANNMPIDLGHVLHLCALDIICGEHKKAQRLIM